MAGMKQYTETVKQYKVTDIITGQTEWFDTFDAFCVEYAFGFESEEALDMLADLEDAIRRGRSTFGLEQYLGLKVEEEWVEDRKWYAA
jgi:hypothetical protein